MLKILLILCELHFITFTTFTYFTLCLQIDTLFTSPDFCLKLAISCFQCKDKHIVYHFYFLLEVKIFVTFYVKINMWSTILNFCLNSNCCHIFDFLLDNKSSFLNILREDRKTVNHVFRIRFPAIYNITMFVNLQNWPIRVPGQNVVF